MMLRHFAFNAGPRSIPLAPLLLLLLPHLLVQLQASEGNSLVPSSFHTVDYLTSSNVNCRTFPQPDLIIITEINGPSAHLERSISFMNDASLSKKS